MRLRKANGAIAASGACCRAFTKKISKVSSSVSDGAASTASGTSTTTMPERSVADALPGMVDEIHNYSAVKSFVARWAVAKRAFAFPPLALGLAMAVSPPAASAVHWATVLCAIGCLQRLNVRGWQPKGSTKDDLSRRSILVTGGTEGLGLTLVTRLLDAGAEVTVLSRATPQKEDMTRAHVAEHAVEKDKALDRLEFITCDLSDPHAVASTVALLRKNKYSLDVLVNNAATFNDVPMTAKKCPSLEQHVAANFLGPFALTEGLLPLLRASPHGGRVVYVTCGIHGNVRSGTVIASRLAVKPDSASSLNMSIACYGAAKLASLYHVKSLCERRLEVVGKSTKPLVACSVDPGSFVSNHFFEKGSDPFLGRGSFGNAIRVLMKKTPDEAVGAVFDCCARSDLTNGGHYLEGFNLPSALSRQAHNERQRADVMAWASQRAKALGFLAAK